MEYRVIRSGDRSDYLEHAIFGGGRQKGAQNKNHKYLARAWWKNKWRYAYTEAEVRALQMLGKAKETASDVKEKAQDTAAKVKTSAEKAKSVATGQYAKSVDAKETKAAQNYYRAKEDYQKQTTQAKNATKRIGENLNLAEKVFNTKSGQKKMQQTTDAAGRYTNNAKKAREAMDKYGDEAKAAAKEKESTAYKVSNAVNNASNKLNSTAKSAKEAVAKASSDAKNSSTAKYVTNAVEARKAEKDREAAEKAGDKQAAIEANNRYENAKHQQNKAASEIKDKTSNAAKSAKEKVTSTAEKGKAKAEELLSGMKKADKQPETTSNNTALPTRSSESSRGRKYEGTGHKAEARKEEGGVAGGPVSGNTNMQGRGEKENKGQSLKEKASNLAKKVSDTAEADKLGAHLTKKNAENYLNSDNNKAVTDTAGKSTLKGQKVTTSYSEGDSLLNKTTITKKKNEDGTVEYEHHTEYGKIAQATKKGKEAVESLFDNKKTPKYSLSTKELKEYTPPWLEGYHFKDNSSNKSLSETMEKGKNKAQEVLNKVSNTAKATAAKVYDKATDQIEKVRESDAMAYANKAADKVKEKVSNTAEKVADTVADTTASAKHIADAKKARVKYGTDSVQYKEAKAHVDYDEAVDDLAKARKKYGVDSAQYKQAAAAESQAREKWQNAREQNLYKNNKEYRTYSDRASYLGSYLDNWDKKGGPQTAEGKANYQKMLNELRGLESKMDAMKRG